MHSEDTFLSNQNYGKINVFVNLKANRSHFLDDMIFEKSKLFLLLVLGQSSSSGRTMYRDLQRSC